MAPRVRVLDPAPGIRGDAVVTLDLIDGSLGAAGGPRRYLTHVLAVATKGPIHPDRLRALAPLAQRILDGAGPDADLTLPADEAFDALVREVTRW